MKKVLLIILSFITLSNILNAQNESNKLIHNIELSLERGLGGGDYGLQAKFNHHWHENRKVNFSSGLSYSSFWGPKKQENIRTNGFDADNHLRLYSGLNVNLSKKMYLFLEGYIGGYHALTKGSFKHEVFDIDRNFKSSEFLFDYGSRLVIEYRLKNNIGIQVLLNNSWKQINNSLGFYVGLFEGQPDGKMSFGLGINYQLN